LHKLYGVEQQLAFSLAQFVQINRQFGSNRPTVMLDFGGMAGLSAVRIASQVNMRKEIERGEVIIVVSSLGFDMKAEFTKPAAQRLDFLNRDEALFLESHRHLVQHVQGDAAALLRTTVVTPNGRRVPLRGNIDLLHERLALAHGQKNDLDIPRLGKLVSPRGELWMSSASRHMMSTIDSADQPEPDLITARTIAHELGLANLQELGFTARPLTTDSGYTVYRHQQSA
jgi:hypothetical protein